MRGKGRAVNGLEERLHRRWIHQKAARELVDRGAACKILREIIVHGADGRKLFRCGTALVHFGIERGKVRRAGRGAALLFRTRDLHRTLDHAVQQLRLLRLRGAVIDLFAHAARNKKSALAQLAQVVRHGGRAHAHRRREVDDALLAVAQQPENAHAAAVGEKLEDVGHGLKAARRFHRFLQPEHRAVAVVVGQMGFAHRVFRLSFSLAARSFYPVWKFVSPKRKRRALAP